MNPEEYRIWRRRRTMSRFFAAEAWLAGEMGWKEGAADYADRSRRLWEEVQSAAEKARTRWVIALATPDDALRTQCIFLGPNGLVEDPGDAVSYASFSEAEQERMKSETPYGRSVEPVDYHKQLYEQSKRESESLRAKTSERVNTSDK